MRMTQEHADATWVIAVHASETDARLQEMLLSLQYRIPTIPFVARRSAAAVTSATIVGNQRLIDHLFDNLYTEASGRQLLLDEGLSFAHPHFVAATTTNGVRTRRRVNVCLCGDKRGAGPLHRATKSPAGDAQSSGDRAFALASLTSLANLLEIHRAAGEPTSAESEVFAGYLPYRTADPHRGSKTNHFPG